MAVWHFEGICVTNYITLIRFGEHWLRFYLF